MEAKTIKIHDGIAGSIIVLGVVLAKVSDPAWMWLSGAIGAAMVVSAVTGFCPVYRALNKLGLK
ncbi:MAG: DUF2892 domain-containing protein [Candidatus Omnitrophota bacterium]|nr:DUF2892 domain-containing protein [Candidatus Omnitrophota bacterium]